MALGHLRINRTPHPLAYSELSFSVEATHDLRWTFELRAVGKPGGSYPQVDANGYLALPSALAKGERHATTLAGEAAHALMFYEHEHLLFQQARIALTGLGARRYALDIRGTVRDQGRDLRIAAKAIATVEHIAVGPQHENDARQLLPTVGLTAEARTFVWTRHANGVFALLSPKAARSEAAREKIYKQLKRMNVPRVLRAANLPTDRQQLWADYAHVRRAKAAILAELKRRFPADVRALLRPAAVELESYSSSLL